MPDSLRLFIHSQERKQVEAMPVVGDVMYLAQRHNVQRIDHGPKTTARTFLNAINATEHDVRRLQRPAALELRIRRRTTPTLRVTLRARLRPITIKIRPANHHHDPAGHSWTRRSAGHSSISAPAR